MDLVAFLTARLDEDEATAKAAAADWLDEEFPFEWDDLPDDAFTHIMRHDPARVLREVKAGRAILAMYADGLAYDDYAVGRVIRVLVAVYSDHPDYDEKWGQA